MFLGKTLVLWELFFVFFIVVLNYFLQSFCFLIKLICLLTMSLAPLYMLFWFHLIDLTTDKVTEFVENFD